MAGTAESGDQFGRSLAAGSFGADGGPFGIDDLAIGVPGEDLDPSPVNAGMVNVLYGRDGGIDGTGHLLTQSTSGLTGTAELDDEFGHALVAGDFDGDTFSDLAIGVHFESVGSLAKAGSVNVAYGASAGFATQLRASSGIRTPRTSRATPRPETNWGIR